MLTGWRAALSHNGQTFRHAFSDLKQCFQVVELKLSYNNPGELTIAKLEKKYG